jgi:hypothetical protein
MLPYDVLQQLVRDRCEQRQAEARAERLELPARTPWRLRTSRPALGTALALLARGPRGAGSS